ncbi:vitamin D-binding protein-like [Rhinophrynus dorsalis]
MHAVFQTNSLILYSQIAVNNSLQDVKRLVSNLTKFISDCCRHDAGTGCFQDKTGNYLIIHECVTITLQSLRIKKYQHVVAKGKQNEKHATKMYNMVLQHIYHISRQYRIFPLKTMAKIIIASLKMYNNCCINSASLSCVKETGVGKVNKVAVKCIEYGYGALGIQYFTLLHPQSTMMKAAEFASTYEQFSSKCCDPTKWTSNCFLDESEVLVLRFCSKSSSAAQRICCRESGLKRAECLSNIAIQEAWDIPGEIRVTPEQLCTIYNAHDGSLIVWYTYEYTRRHRNDPLDAVMKSVSEFESVVIAYDPNFCF